METYDIVGTILLSFIFDDEQRDFLIDSGVLESDGSTVWYVNHKGRFESITEAHVVDVGLEDGRIVRRVTA